MENESKIRTIALSEVSDAQLNYAAQYLKITPDEVVNRALGRALGDMIKERGSDRDGDAAYYAEIIGKK